MILGHFFAKVKTGQPSSAGREGPLEACGGFPSPTPWDQGGCQKLCESFEWGREFCPVQDRQV